MTTTAEATEVPEFVVGKDGREIRVGDRIAYAVSVFRSAVLRVGTLEKIYHQEGGWNNSLKLRIMPDEPAGYAGKIRPSFIYAQGGDFVKLS